mmetsp:Transcript_206/g.235  ORF Transcript_206/g.235 Transcript_206/m.235 type:complete len:230 (+) Transcript_206:474-1163(+)
MPDQPHIGHGIAEEGNGVIDGFVLGRAGGSQTHLVRERTVPDGLLIVFGIALQQQTLPPQTQIKKAGVTFLPTIKGSEFDIGAVEVEVEVVVRRRLLAGLWVLLFEKGLVDELVFVQAGTVILIEFPPRRKVRTGSTFLGRHRDVVVSCRRGNIVVGVSILPKALQFPKISSSVVIALVIAAAAAAATATTAVHRPGSNPIQCLEEVLLISPCHRQQIAHRNSEQQYQR